MARIGWSHLVVIRHAEKKLANSPSLRPFATADGGYFENEQGMLEELGAAGWELLFIREAGDDLHYYFKRPRS